MSRESAEDRGMVFRQVGAINLAAEFSTYIAQIVLFDLPDTPIVSVK